MNKQICKIKNCICKLHINMEKSLKTDKLYDKFQETCERYAKRYVITLKKDIPPLIKEIKSIYDAHVFQYEKDVMSLPEFAKLDHKSKKEECDNIFWDEVPDCIAQIIDPD